jgi:aryl-alcohol dehydrogenase-like predicted oxidoreductase
VDKRILGQSELEITRIGLGTWAIGGPWLFGWGKQDDAESIRAIHRALDGGINWIDTAPAYGLGHGEEIVAAALRQTDHDPLVFTKCGIVWNEKGTPSQTLRRESIVREVEASLRRLGVEVIDLYQVHWPIPEEEIEEGCAAVEELRQAGKIRYAGVSNFSVAQMERVRERLAITSLQPPYSLVQPEVEKEILPYCAAQGIGVINYSPMGSGLLTGKMTRERLATLPADDWRRRNENFQEPKLSRNLALVEVLAGIAARHGCSVAEAAIAWTLQNPAVTGAIVGVRHPEQVDGILGAASVELTDEDTAALTEVRAAF